jgi:hypothetical protein
MEYVDPMLMVSIGALALGLLMVIAGYAARPRGQIRTRQGAEIAASFVAILGAMTMLAGTIYLVRAI